MTSYKVPRCILLYTEQKSLKERGDRQCSSSACRNSSITFCVRLVAYHFERIVLFTESKVLKPRLFGLDSSHMQSLPAFTIQSHELRFFGERNETRMIDMLTEWSLERGKQSETLT